MHEWLVFPDPGALAPGYHFAAGKRFLAWWRASGRLEFPPDDPRRIWAELKELRVECAASAANLETVVARFKDAAMAQMARRDDGADRFRRLQRALDEKATIVAELEQKKVELELTQEQLLLQLCRQGEELDSRSAELATAEQTIALLNGLIGLPDRTKAAPHQAAG